MKLLLTLLLAITLSACSGVKINTDYAVEQDFSQYKRFAWHPDGVQPSKSLDTMGGDIYDSRVRRFVSQALAERGFEQSSQPDFYINYGVVTEDRVSIRSYNTYGGYGPGWYGYGYYGPYYGGVGSTQTTVSYYTQGMLILDVIDARNNQLVWRSTADSRVDNSSTPQKKEENMRKIIDGMLAKFPPPPGG